MLRVTLIKASDLVASDSALEGLKSDPFVVFQVGKEVQQSSCITQQLDPEWRPRECFELPVIHGEKDVLKVQVYDHDTFNEHDHLGTLVLPVSQFSRHANLPQHQIYFLEVPEEFAAQECQSTIELDICYLAGGGNAEVTLRMWENEVWSLTGGWAPSDTEIYRRYSSYDDTMTSNRFELAAPPVPPGREGQGWAYLVDTNRGDEGWMYAYNFLGPFAAAKTMNSYVRRRLWENKCVVV